MDKDLILLLLLLATSDSAGSSGGDETDLLTSGGTSLDGRSLSDVLMVTTTVGMFDGVHGHTSDLRPAVPLDLNKEKRMMSGLIVFPKRAQTQEIRRNVCYYTDAPRVS